MNDNKLNDIIQTTLQNLRTMVDANTVIGTPIKAEPGITIIPISKISMGFASGGVDYNGKNEEAKASKLTNFGGGNGTGLSVSPVGFLVVNSRGEVELLNIGVPTPNDPIEQITAIIERSPEIIEKFKTVFAKKKDNNDEDETINVK